jgi:exopolysaccharide production protein ExoY
MFRSDSTAHGNVVRRFTPGGGGPSASPMYVQPRKLSTLERAAKRTTDIVGALTFFVLFGPLYLLVALCVGISMGRPVHFWQHRLGANGQRFRFYKFRSMVRNSEHVLDEFLSRNDMARTEWDTFQKLEKDPRVTPTGQWIRKLSLDELPQFWNVVKGEMSLVGPRPLPADQVAANLELLGPRHEVSAGVTGWWQINGRSGVSPEEAVHLDQFYIENWSLALDLYIVVRTFGAVLARRGAH